MSYKTKGSVKALPFLYQNEREGLVMPNIKNDKKATVSKKETVEKKTTKSKSVDDLKSLADEKKEVAAVRYGITNCDNLRLRTAPNTDSEIIKMLQKGTQVEILGDANQDFYKVSGGYLMKRFIDIHEK